MGVVRKTILMLATAMAVLPSCNKTSDPVSEPEEEKTTYAVGDLYDVFGVKGIVFATSSEGKHGTIVSLEEWSSKWATAGDFCGAQYPEFGGYNWSVITALYNWENVFSAFAVCNTLNTKNVVGWYLPAINELSEIYTGLVKDNLEKTNATIKSAGGVELKTSTYWSSTEVGNGMAYFCNFSKGYDETGYDNTNVGKSNVYLVRAAKRF